MMVFKTKAGSANSLHSSWEFRAVFNVNRATKGHELVDKTSPNAKMSCKKQKVLQRVAFLTGGWDWLDVESNCEEHAGSDKRFENTTVPIR